MIPGEYLLFVERWQAISFQLLLQCELTPYHFYTVSSDELNWEQIFPNAVGENAKGFYPISNACGQRGISYTSSTTHTCPPGEEIYQCDVDFNAKITATDKSLFDGSPPPLKCFPRNAQRTVTGYFDPYIGRVINKEGDVVPSKTGRTDVEG